MKHNSCSPIKGNWATKKLKGQDHIVAPVILLTEGVHNNLYYPPSEMKKTAHLWNGVPLVVQHPLLNGIPISANSPDVDEQQGVGRLYDVVFVAGKLKGNIYVLKSSLGKFPEVSHYLEKGLPLEISTGLFSDDEMINGKWNGEQYTGIVRNHKPDHLALLPGGIGACSFNDGCGVRINGMSHSQIDKAIRTALELEKRDAKKWYFYIREIFPTYFVYEEEGNNVDSPAISTTAGKLYKRAYTISKDVVTLSDGAQEVKEDKKYVPVTNASAAALIYGDKKKEFFDYAKKSVAKFNHAEHDQKDHGSWAKGAGGVIGSEIDQLKKKLANLEFEKKLNTPIGKMDKKVAAEVFEKLARDTEFGTRYSNSRTGFSLEELDKDNMRLVLRQEDPRSWDNSTGGYVKKTISKNTKMKSLYEEMVKMTKDPQIVKARASWKSYAKGFRDYLAAGGSSGYPGHTKDSDHLKGAFYSRKK